MLILGVPVFMATPKLNYPSTSSLLKKVEFRKIAMDEIERPGKIIPVPIYKHTNTHRCMYKYMYLNLFYFIP